MEVTFPSQNCWELGCGKCQAIGKCSVKGTIAQIVTNLDDFPALSTAVFVHARQVGGRLWHLSWSRLASWQSMLHHASEKGCTLPLCHAILCTFITLEFHSGRELGSSGDRLHFPGGSPFPRQSLLGGLPGIWSCPIKPVPGCSL